MNMHILDNGWIVGDELKVCWFFSEENKWLPLLQNGPFLANSIIENESMWWHIIVCLGIALLNVNDGWYRLCSHK